MRKIQKYDRDVVWPGRKVEVDPLHAAFLRCHETKLEMESDIKESCRPNLFGQSKHCIVDRLWTRLSPIVLIRRRSVNLTFRFWHGQAHRVSCGNFATGGTGTT